MVRNVERFADRVRDPVQAVFDDRPLATHLVGMMSQGVLKAFSWTCRRWRSDAFFLAPDACRTLVRLTNWPEERRRSEASSGVDRKAQYREQAKAWREQLLESIRMGSQDPQPADSASSASQCLDLATSSSARAVPLWGFGGGPFCGPQEWYRQACFCDKHVSDDGFCSALERGVPGDVRRLFVPSSCLTNAGVIRALRPHCFALSDLCLSNCSPAGQVTGEAFRSLGQHSFSALRRLILIDVPDVPLGVLAAAGALETLMIKGRISTTSIEALSRCRGLRTLKLTLEPKVVHDPFIRVFTECVELRTIDIYRATDVTDQILGCLMLHAQYLEEFSGLHMSNSYALSSALVEAFRAHFKNARIVLDNAATESFL